MRENDLRFTKVWRDGTSFRARALWSLESMKMEEKKIPLTAIAECGEKPSVSRFVGGVSRLEERQTKRERE